MLIFHDPRCAEYGSYLRPEQPARVLRTAAHLRRTHPQWRWEQPDAAIATDDVLIAVHAASRYGCRVTTTTISQQQYDLARERKRTLVSHARLAAFAQTPAEIGPGCVREAIVGEFAALQPHWLPTEDGTDSVCLFHAARLGGRR